MHIHRTLSLSRRGELIPQVGAFLLALWGLAAFPARGGAANGDVISVSNILQPTECTDIAFDSSANPAGGSFWVLGRLSGKIYHVSADLTSLLGQINNPHGTGALPNFILSWGLAYRPTTKTLFVLAQDGPNWKVKEVKTSDGTEVAAGGFAINVPAADAASAGLRGLAYDTVNRNLWYLDANNDKVVQIDLSGNPVASFALPGDFPPETILRGEGLSVELEQISDSVFEPRIYVAYGDIFHVNPSQIIQLKLDGTPTGIEIPLTGVPFPNLRGFQTYRLGAQRRIALLADQGKILQIEQVIPRPVPPSMLKCSLTLANKVELKWENNGSSASASHEYGGDIQILRNGVAFTTVPGTTVTFIDATPLEGTSTYSLRAADTKGGELSPESFKCQVTVGPSGIVHWVPFPGASPYDVARDPAKGDIYVTDNVGLQGTGKIFHFDANLALIEEIPSPWQRPGPIAFLPSIQIQNVVLENVLAVGRTDGVSLVKIIDTAGVEKTTISLEANVPSPQIGGLSYIAAKQQFVFLEQSTHTIIVDDSTGRKQRECLPPSLLNLPAMDSGITYDPIQDTFLVVFQDGVVRELYTGGGGLCVPTGFEFTLASLGEGSTTPGFTGGIQIAGNALLVCGHDSHALFQVLIFPFAATFVRGDFDRSGAVSLTDAVACARYLFQTGTAPNCQDAADSNDDGILDISDPVYLLFFLFLQGPPPPPPYPDPGGDPTFRDNLSCEGDGGT